MNRDSQSSVRSSKKAKKPFLSPSKVVPPARLSREILRSSILNQATEALTDKAGMKNAILLQAPAGYGKSTCMRQIYTALAKNGYANIWLNLQESDNDLSRFLEGFALAIAPYTQEPDRLTDESLRNGELAQIIFETLSLLDQPCALFFDNFELLRSPGVTGLIGRGVASLPQNCLLLISSRTHPSIGLSRMRANEALIEFGADDLRFSLEETNSFMREHEIGEIPGQHMETLHQRTDGWAVALKLAALSLGDAPKSGTFVENFSGSNAAVATYLAEDVLSSLPEDMQAFMMESSILDEISPDLCNQIFDRTDSQEMIRELESRNLFLTEADASNELYVYHALFRDFLQNQLRRRRGFAVKGLHLAAYKTYVQQDRPIIATRHALLAGETDRAVELLNLHVDDLLRQGFIGMLTRLLRQLDTASLSSNPYLNVVYSLCETFTRGPQSGYKLIQNENCDSLPEKPAAYLQALRPMQLGMMDRIQEAHELGLEATKAVDDTYPYAQATLAQALTQTSIILGEHEEARRYCDQARFIQSQHSAVINIALAESAEALIDLMNGHLKHATGRLKGAMQTLNDERFGSHRGVALTAIQLAETLYENNQYERARHLLEANLPLVQDIGPADTLITANVIYSRISAGEGDTEQALQSLIELENSGHRLNLPRVVASARVERAALLLSISDRVTAQAKTSLDQLDLAEKTYDWGSAQSLWFSANDTLTPEIGRLRWKTRNGQAADAVNPLRELLKGAERVKRMRRALKLRILLSEALYSVGETNSALRNMKQALEFADAEGYLRTFTEEGASLDPIFSELYEQERQNLRLRGEEPVELDNLQFLEHWYRRRPATSQINETANNLVEPLTRKELEVLQVLSLGLSNNDMAEKLFISESTVRTHLRNINLKLNAKNRTEAVSIARQLRLIDI